MDKEPTKTRKNVKRRTTVKENEADNRQHKVRGKSGEKISVNDRGEESKRVEKELSGKYIGTIIIWKKYCTTKWGKEGVIENRAIDPSAVAKLVDKFKKNFDRCNPRFRMKITLDADAVPKLLQALTMSKDELLASSNEHNYPRMTDEIFEQIGCDFVLQSGHHRSLALEKVFPYDCDQWWPADVYESGLSLLALDYLRTNAEETHTPSNNGVPLLQLTKLYKDLDLLRSNMIMDAKEREMKMNDFVMSIKNKITELGSHRAQQFWDRKGVRTGVCACLNIPGFRDSLYISNIHGFISLRMIKVVLTYFAC